MSTNSVVKNIHIGKPIYSEKKYENLREMITASARIYTKHPAFLYRNTPQSDVLQKSYPEFLSDMNQLGSAMLFMGMKGKNIAIIGENRYEWVLSYAAAMCGVGTTIPLDRMLPDAEIAGMLERAEVDVLFYTASFEDNIRTIARENKYLSHFICMNPAGNLSQMSDAVEGENITTLADDRHETFEADERFASFASLMQLGRERIAQHDTTYQNLAIDAEAMQVLLFTSGTSSTSKAVMLSHKNLMADVHALAGIFGASHGESLLSILPLHHTFENTCTFLFGLSKGLTIAFSDGLKYLSKNMREFSPSILVGVPLLFDKFRGKAMDEVKKTGMEKKFKIALKLTRILRFVGLDLRKKLFSKIHDSFGGKLRVIIAGGAPFDAALANWYERIGIRVYQGYGLTETSPVIAGCNDRVRKSGTCGEPLPGVEMGIENPDITGTGEIVVRGDMVMQGYWRNTEATEEVLRNGWFHTGDLGRFNRKGLLQITGRSKSVIVLKNGKNVFPEELEALLSRIEYAKESIVWGEQNDAGTIEICTHIVIDRELLPENVRTDDSIIGRMLDAEIKDINRSVSSYKAIRHFVFGEEELPKTTTLKVKRYMEMDELHRMLSEMSAHFATIAGKNIDNFKEAFRKSVLSLKKTSSEMQR